MRALAILLMLPISACYDPADESRGFTPPIPRPHQQYVDQSHDTGGFGSAPLPPPDSPER